MTKTLDLQSARDQLREVLDQTRAFPETGSVLFFRKARVCLGFRGDSHRDLSNPYPTNLVHARVFADADRMGAQRLPGLGRTFTNGAGERAQLYDVAVVKRILVEDLEGAVEVLDSAAAQLGAR